MTLAIPAAKEERWKYTDLAGAVRKLAVSEAPGEPAIKAEGKFAALNAGKVVVDVPAGQDAGVIRITVSGVDGRATEPALAINLGENAQATVVEIHQGGGKQLTNAATHIVLAQGAKLRHFRLQAYGDSGVYVQNTQAFIARDALYDTFTLTMGAALSRNEILARLAGPGAHAELNGVNLLNGTQHGDTTITVEHAAPHCTSHQFYRSVLDARARGVFQGKIHVDRIAQKTDGFQRSDALILSEGAEMDTKPELEIYADDVKCSHGATTGQLDEDALFYLRSRGIGREEARSLLIGAFVDEAVQKIADEAVRREFGGKVESWLSK